MAIDKLCPGLMNTLECNLKCYLLDSISPSIPLLREMTPDDLFALSKRIELIFVSEPTHLIRQGQEVSHFSMVVQGEAQVALNSGAESLPTLRPGQYFGEVSLVLDKPATATIHALPGTVLLTISKKDFLSWCALTHEAIAEMSIRLQGVEVPLIHVIRHSLGYLKFLEFLKSELAPEGGVFWRRVDQLQDKCQLWLETKADKSLHLKKYDPNMSTSRIKMPYLASKSMSIREEPSKPLVEDIRTVMALCDEIMSQHIQDMSPYQINIPSTMIRTIQQDYSSFHARVQEEIESVSDGGILSIAVYQELMQTAFSLFSRAKHEVFMLLKDDNFARWNKSVTFISFIQEMKPYVF